MNKNYSVVLFLYFFSYVTGFSHPPSSIRFIENKNQWDATIQYKATLQSGALFLENNCFTYNLLDGNDFKHPAPPKETISADSIRYRGHAFKVKFEGANPDVVIDPENDYSDYQNYFIGSNPAHWASHVKAYQTIVYRNLYQGIDLKVYSQDNALKYDLVLLPRVDPSQIKLTYDGVDQVYISQEGNLVVKTSAGTVIEKKPYAYQLINGNLVAIPCNFQLSAHSLSFGFPSGYNKNYALTIDPVLLFSTYSGSLADNFGYTATPDSKGFLYAGSSIFGVGYPVTLGAYQTTFGGGAPFFIGGGTDIGITKYDSSGTKRIYSTYLGGSGDEIPHSLIVNAADELYIFGTTGSLNFPFTKLAFDTIFNGGTPIGMFGIQVAYANGSDIIVSKLSSDGASLLASTYLGGAGNDGVLARSPASNLRYNYADEVRGEIELDKSNNVYIASCTRSLNFPIVGTPFQPVFGGGNFDAVLVKMDANLQTISWSSYMGGTLDDAAYSIELDTLDNPYVSGGTTSLNFPVTPGVLYPTNQGGRADGFISYIDKSGSSIIYASYYGSPAYDQTYFVGLDKFNAVYLFGQTAASAINATRYIKAAGFSQPNSGQFISKITPELDSVLWSTTFGTGSGRPNISPTAFLVDLCSKIYLSGWGGSPENNEFLSGTTRPFTMLTTLGPNPPTDYFQATTDSYDFYLFVLEGDASAANYASFFGGNLSEEHVDGGTSRFDRKGKIYQAMCAGCGANSDMPLKPPIGITPLPSTNNSSNCNIGVFKMDFRLPVVVADFNAKNSCVGELVQFENTSLLKSTTTFTWSFGDGTTSTLINPSHTYSTGGAYDVQLVLFDNATCNLADTLTKKLYISTIGSISLDAIADQYTIYKGKSTTIRALPPTGWGYSWSPSSTLSNSTSSAPIATPPVTTTYTVSLSDPQVERCSVLDSVTINVIEIICEEPYIYVPNAFTPNEDGSNELLLVRSLNIRELYFVLYNRWGEKVFETHDQTIGWDGTYKGMKADPGVFDYYIKAVCVDDQEFFKKGNVTLIR